MPSLAGAAHHFPDGISRISHTTTGWTIAYSHDNGRYERPFFENKYLKAWPTLRVRVSRYNDSILIRVTVSKCHSVTQQRLAQMKRLIIAHLKPLI